MAGALTNMMSHGRLLVLLPMLFLVGCVEDDLATSSVEVPSSTPPPPLDDRSIEGQMGPLVGFSSPLFSGCEGHAIGVNAVGMEYVRPPEARQGTVVLELVDGVATGLRLCLFGLDDGVLSVVGEPPLSLDIEFASETEIAVVALPANEPAGFVGLVTVRLTVSPRA